MSERYLEDIKVGDRFRSTPCVVTRKEVVDFAEQFDPQPFHLDPSAAKQTLFRGLAASGWHTASITMRLVVRGQIKLAGGFIGLAVDELRWPRPVRPGDTLQVDSEVVDVRPSKSRPDRGTIRVRNVTTNQDGAIVQTMVATLLVRRRAHFVR